MFSLLYDHKSIDKKKAQLPKKLSLTTFYFGGMTATTLSEFHFLGYLLTLNNKTKLTRPCMKRFYHKHMNMSKSWHVEIIMMQQQSCFTCSYFQLSSLQAMSIATSTFTIAIASLFVFLLDEIIAADL